MSEPNDQILELPIALPDQWGRAPLRDVVEFVADGDWVESKDQGGSDFRLLQISNIGTGSFVETGNYRYVTEETFERLRCTEIREGDVLVARMPEPTGRAWFVNELKGRCITAVDVAIVRPLPERIDGLFLSYFLNTPVNLSRVDGLATGTTRRRVRRADLARLEIPVPRLAEQRAIADVLGALDDKIESNRRLINTVRSLIDTEFMAMFGDAQLVEEISTFAAVVDCLHSKKPEKVEHGNQLLQLSNISNDGFLLLGNHYPISHSDYSRWTANIEVNEGDLVLTNVGRVGALARIPTGVKAALGRNMTAIRGYSSCEQIFLFACLNNEWVRREMIKLVDVGTIMDALNVHAIRRIKVPEASESQLLEFSDVSAPLVYRAERAIRESDELTTLRDALLPALLSGRLRVRDAEKVVEGAL